MTYYDILGIGRTADDAEIKKAYRRMLIAFHPDTYRGDKQFAADKTQEIIEAYTVLRDPAARKSYDELISSQAQDTAAAGRRPRKNRDEDAAASYYSQKTKPKGFTKLKLALGVLGIIFVIFVVVLFISIMKSVYAA